MGDGMDYVPAPHGDEAAAMLARVEGGGSRPGGMGMGLSTGAAGGPLSAGLGYGSDAFEYGAYDDEFDAGRGRLVGAGLESMVRGTGNRA